VHHDRYGFVPFSAFKAPRIPANVSTIYVTSDYPNRAEEFDFSKGKANKEACTKILSALSAHLRAEFPQTSVAVIRGDDLFNDLARFTQAKVLFCSASTFCLWPALASHGTVYFPISTVILEGQQKLLMSHVHWLTEPAMVRFMHEESIEIILETLQTNGLQQ